MFQNVAKRGAICPLGQCALRIKFGSPGAQLGNLFSFWIRFGRVFREAVQRHQTSVLGLQPAAPVWRGRVPYVGDRLALGLTIGDPEVVGTFANGLLPDLAWDSPFMMRPAPVGKALLP